MRKRSSSILLFWQNEETMKKEYQDEEKGKRREQKDQQDHKNDWKQLRIQSNGLQNTMTSDFENVKIKMSERRIMIS
jgi:hypothetical protein